MFKRMYRILVGGALTSAVLTTPAHAVKEHYCETTTVAAGHACAGANAHSGTVYTDVQLDHTGCAAIGLGYGGDHVPSGGDTVAIACTVGAGTNGACSGSWGGNAHGAVWNQNASTGDYVYEAHITVPATNCPGDNLLFAGRRAVGDDDPDGPALDPATAREVLEDAGGTVWRVATTGGDVCLVERPAGDAYGVSSRFACRTAEDVAATGIVAGVPGDWYGIGPEAVPTVAVAAGGERRALSVAPDRAFRLPGDASSYTVGGETVALPASRTS